MDYYTVMKKTLLALMLVVAMAVPTTAQANLKNSTADVPTIAVLDTALDTSIPAIKDHLVGEVCILDWTSCPNGSNFMEGEGSSVLPMNILSSRDFNHGTQMVSSIIQTNPNVNILFIRIIGNTAAGARQTQKSTLVPNVLNWIYNNKQKYNIQAVSMSQGHHNLLSTADYCPVNSELESALAKLSTIDVPVFFASGNQRDYKRVDWPACSSAPNVIGVSGAESYGAPALYSNFDVNRTDFFENGLLKIQFPGGNWDYSAGSSVATAVLAAKWMGIKTVKGSLTYSQIYNLFKSTAKTISSQNVQSALMIDYMSALQGNANVSTQSQSNADKLAADKLAADKLAADKAAIKAQAEKAIADAEAQYNLELKAAQDKLAAIKAQWLAKLNG